MSALVDRVQRVRTLIPVRALPTLARRRVDRLYNNEGFRLAQEREMAFLLEHTDRAAEIGEISRRYTEFALLRGYRRWHPRHVADQTVHGIEWLTTSRDRERGVLLSFVHHGQYDGLFPALAREGVPIDIITAPEAFEPSCDVQLRQHVKVASQHPTSTLVSAAIGSKGMVERLEAGAVVAIASDVSGSTPVRFLGRELRLASGAARVAIRADAPVVMVTSRQDGDRRPALQVHEPLEPRDFAGHEDLLAEILRRHEPAVLAWPEAFDSPYGRLGAPPPVEVDPALSRQSAPNREPT